MTARSADSSRGRFDVYVQQFPVAQGRWQISTAGGLQPKWRRDGKELFYLGLDGTLMAVALRLDTLAEPARPQPLFATRVTPTTGFVWHEYDVSPDGQRFLVNTAAHASSSPVVVVLNWPGLRQ